MMYQCQNSSKCIPLSYIGNGYHDCDYGDDEEMKIDRFCGIDKNDLFFKCPTEDKCIHRNRVKDGKCDCQVDQYDTCYDENLDLYHERHHIEYSKICDGVVDLIPVLINGQHETDETDCALWPCNNTYVRCNDFWNCPNGADETGCDNGFSAAECPVNTHLCVLYTTYQKICLPIHRVNDGIVDCVGGIDETFLCPVKNPSDKQKQFYCRNNGSGMCIPRSSVCDQIIDCENADDEQYCNLLVTKVFRINQDQSNIKRISHNTMKSKRNVITTQLSTKDIREDYCHRGFSIKVLSGVNRNLTTTTCLCPPSYYGDRCQFQNQRVSFTMRISPSPFSEDRLFLYVISLIDDSAERVIHSYERLSNLYIDKLYPKFNVHLVYSARPKDTSKQYAIHIDIYEHLTLVYRGSHLIPLKFPFLPVERVAVELDLPHQYQIIQTCSNQQCIHGDCIQYLNNPENPNFCRCHIGWTGKYCNISYMCTCSPDSLCLGITSNNQSICVCPPHKFGPQCFLTKSACQHVQC